MKARDLMTATPFTVATTDTVERAAQLMRDLRIGCLPVVEHGGGATLVGVITDRDIAVRCVASGHHTSCHVRDHMSTGAQTVTPDAEAAEVLQKMERAQVRRLPVVTDDGALVGMIAQADLATKLGPLQPLRVEEYLQHLSASSLLTGATHVF